MENLRDEFAARAMAVLLPRWKGFEFDEVLSAETAGCLFRMATSSYEVADAMLEARKQNLIPDKFPWHELPIGISNALIRHFGEDRWPLSCADLLEIGHQRMLHHLHIRCYGITHARRISKKLKEMGQCEDWTKT